MRVALLAGCVQQVVAPEINEATIRLLTRHGAEVVIVRGAGCCGALQHHLGKTGPSHRFARANIAAWTREIDGDGLDAIVINASGCGTQVKDYGFMFREDAAWAERAARVAALARDVTEVMTALGGNETKALGRPAPRIASPGPTPPQGRARSTATAWTRSWSTPRAAAPR